MHSLVIEARVAVECGATASRARVAAPLAAVAAPSAAPRLSGSLSQNGVPMRRLASAAASAPMLQQSSAPVMPQSTVIPGSASALRRQLNLLRVDSSGAIRDIKMPITQLKDESRLSMRDILVLEQPSGLIQARILPRRHCIAMTVGYIRALVFIDRVYLFTPQVSHVQTYAHALASFLSTFSQQQTGAIHLTAPSPSPGVSSGLSAQQQHHQHSNETTHASNAGSGVPPVSEEPAPFELLVMEHALLTIQARQAKRVAYAKRVLDSLLNKMGTIERDDSRWYSLFPLMNTITHYEMTSRGLCECVRALLDDDRDMREACLTAKARLSEEILARAREHARSSAAAYDPTVKSTRQPSVSAGGGGVDHASPSAGDGEDVTRGANGAQQQLEGSDAFLGYAASPISSHHHILAAMRDGHHNGSSNNGVSAAKGGILVSHPAAGGATVGELPAATASGSARTVAKPLFPRSDPQKLIEAVVTRGDFDNPAPTGSMSTVEIEAEPLSTSPYHYPEVNGVFVSPSSHILTGSGYYVDEEDEPPPRRFSSSREGISSTRSARRGSSRGSSTSRSMPSSSSSSSIPSSSSIDSTGSAAITSSSTLPSLPPVDAASASLPNRPLLRGDDEDGGTGGLSLRATQQQQHRERQLAAYHHAAEDNHHHPQHSNIINRRSGASSGSSHVTGGASGGGSSPLRILGGSGSGHANPGLPAVLRVPADALSQLELMLESVYHQSAETVVSVVELSRALRSKTELLELQQSNYRNYLLSISVRLSVLTVSISTAALITSGFGMNLHSGLETTPGLFWAAVGISAGAGAYCYRWFDKWSTKANPATSYARRLAAFQDLLYKLDVKLDAAKSVVAVATAGSAAGGSSGDIGPSPPPPSSMASSAGDGGDVDGSHALLYAERSSSFLGGPGSSLGGFQPGGAATARAAAAAAERRLGKDEFRRLHEKTTGRPMSSDEVDLLFELLDADSDGQLKLEEAITTYDSATASAGGGSLQSRLQGLNGGSASSANSAAGKQAAAATADRADPRGSVYAYSYGDQKLR